MGVHFTCLPLVGEWCDPALVQALVVNVEGDETELLVATSDGDDRVCTLFRAPFPSLVEALAAADEIGRHVSLVCPESGIQLLPYVNAWMNPLLARALRSYDDAGVYRLWVCVDAPGAPIPVNLFHADFETLEAVEEAKSELGRYLAFMHAHPEFAHDPEMALLPGQVEDEDPIAGDRPRRRMH